MGYSVSLCVTMMRLLLGCVLVLRPHYCEETVYRGTDLRIGEDSVQGQTGFETEESDWTLSNMRVIRTNDSMENIYSIPGEGHVIVPELSMSGKDMGQMSIMLNISLRSKVAVEFSMFVSGYDPADQGLLSRNPELEILLPEPASHSRGAIYLTSLARLGAEPGVWSKYRTETMAEGSEGQCRLTIEARMGVGTLALDNVRVEVVPVVVSGQGKNGEENVTETIGKENVTETNGEVNVTETIGKENVTETNGKENFTETNGEENVTKTNGEENVTKTNGEENVTETNGKENVTETNGKAEETQMTTLANMSASTTNLTATTHSTDSSMYGYSGEVVLICLTVTFILLFLCMVYKYHRLKSHMGDYRLNQGGDRQHGQDNQGMQVQMNYRMED